MQLCICTWNTCPQDSPNDSNNCRGDKTCKVFGYMGDYICDDNNNNCGCVLPACLRACVLARPCVSAARGSSSSAAVACAVLAPTLCV